MSAKLFLARHGESTANIPGQELIRGYGDYPLTALGKQQAAALGDKLAELGVQHVATDDILRSRLTADYVARACNCEPTHDFGLRTWNVGAFEGLPELTTKPIVMRFVHNVHLCPPEGERYSEFFNRWRDAFWHYFQRARETQQSYALIVHSGQFATVDDILLERGSTPTADYEPTPGNILEVSVESSPQVRVL